MTSEGKVVVFTIDQPFAVALPALRRALGMERLRILHEVDTSARVRQELGVGLKQNVVLYVDDPIQLLEATVMDPAGGLFIPEPVVLSAARKGCRVSVRSIRPLVGSDLPVSVRSAVANLHERVLAAIQRIGRKETAVEQVADHSAVSA
jgi:hypothetical protein